MLSESPSNVFILDNGGYSVKAGYAKDSVPKIIPNCITKAKNESRRTFVGYQLDECKNFSGLYYMYPCERGYILNWDFQKRIWDLIFNHYKVDFKDTCLIVTEPYFNFISIQETIIEILFEEYKFHSILGINAGSLSAYHYLKDNPTELCCMLVESGFSFTHIVPYIKAKKIDKGIKRIDIGGKHLTNYLKEVLSYRQLNVLDETYVVNQMKEDTCFVSSNFWKDMEICQRKPAENAIIREYVLPDYDATRRGYMRSPGEANDKNEQVIKVSNERFQVPELLFHPCDVNMNEMGISEAIMHCSGLTNKDIEPHLLKNILLTGGNACFPFMKERVLQDICSTADCLYDVNVTVPKSPITYAWEGGALLCKDPEFSKMVLTHKKYKEQGLHESLTMFDI